MHTLEELTARLARATRALSERRGQQHRLILDRGVCSARLDAAKEQTQVFEQVAFLLQQTAEHARVQARQRIESLVTSTLRSVFGPDYAFRIELVEKGGRPEAEFYVVSSCGGELLQTRPQDSRGGGIVDVLSLGLRIAVLQTYRPPMDGALILDEPAKHVSDEFIQPVAQFLQTVSGVFGRQVIMVTHNAHLAETAEVAYHVVLQGDRSVVSRAG